MDCHSTDGGGGFSGTAPSETPPDVCPGVPYLEGRDRDGGNGRRTRDHSGDTSLIRAIREGVEADGEEMDWDMPRWDLSFDDAKDLLEYLKML